MNKNVGKMGSQFAETLKQYLIYVNGEYGMTVKGAIRDRNLDYIEDCVYKNIPKIKPANHPHFAQSVEFVEGVKKEKGKQYLKHIDMYHKAYSPLWKLCTELMKSEIEGLEGYQEVSDNAKTIELLYMIEDVMTECTSNMHPLHSVMLTMESLFKCYQNDLTLT